MSSRSCISRAFPDDVTHESSTLLQAEYVIRPDVALEAPGTRRAAGSASPRTRRANRPLKPGAPGEHGAPVTLLIVAGGEPREFELRLRAAVGLLAELEEPVDLVLCDPPWALRRGSGHFADGAPGIGDHTRIVPGYVDVNVERYLEFTHGWVTQAAAALRPAGQLAVITGPQRAAIVQRAAENARITWVSSIVRRREFPLATLSADGRASGSVGRLRAAWRPTGSARAFREARPAVAP